MMLLFIGLAGLLGWVVGYYVGAVKEFQRWQPLVIKGSKTLNDASNVIENQQKLIEQQDRLLNQGSKIIRAAVSNVVQ